MTDFTRVRALTVPEGEVVRILREGRVLWAKPESAREA